jgi:hypothetical protein
MLCVLEIAVHDTNAMQYVLRSHPFLYTAQQQSLTELKAAYTVMLLMA